MKIAGEPHVQVRAGLCGVLHFSEGAEGSPDQRGHRQVLEALRGRDHARQHDQAAAGGTLQVRIVITSVSLILF